MNFAAFAAYLGSFLAFELELIIAKLLLPHYGGSALVWTTSVMFFQGLMVAALAWARWALRHWEPARYFRLHLVLLILPILFFPILPEPPGENANFLIGLLKSLGFSVGAVFFVLSMTTPILQSRLADGERGYSLYAASNAGALAALVAYPLIIEPLLTLKIQLNLWYAGYALFLLLHLPLLKTASPPAATRAEDAARKPWLWMLLAAGPVMCLLAATSFLSYHMGSVPLLWALPLTVYLVTLVLSFKPNPVDSRRIYAGLLILLALCLLPGLLRFLPSRLMTPRWTELAVTVVLLSGLVVDLLGLFTISIICHGSLARLKPSQDAPGFYLCVAWGGWLGSLAFALLPILAPRNSSLILEWLLAALVSLAALCLRDADKLARLWHEASRPTRWAAGGLVALFVFGLSAVSRAGLADGATLEDRRSYYGVYRVVEWGTLRSFYHGNTIHGRQYQDQYMRPFPLGYYHPHSPLGDVLEDLGVPFKNIGAVGLGIGSVATYGKPGQNIDFYELDPIVAEIAHKHFTHLKDSRASIRVITGDARLALTRSTQTYDLLFLDAFTSDAVPMHLLTREAFQLYLERLTPRGLILIHISSRMVDLRPALAAVAGDLELEGAAKTTLGREVDQDEFISRYVAVGIDKNILSTLTGKLGWKPLSDYKHRRLRVWTDQRSSLLDAFAR